MIPITHVGFGAEEEQLVLDTIRSGSVAQGPLVQRFENEFAELIGVDHVVAVGNGTLALEAAIAALDLVPGDQVITTPFTFVATINALLASGVEVIPADIRADDFTIDIDSVRERITPRTRAIVPVHLYGQTADMLALTELAREHGLRVVEDAAQAHGATDGDYRVGTFDLATFSFYATKNITTGEGGAIATNDAALADRLRVARNQGMRARYEYVAVGHNHRMTDLQAALGIPQLARYDDVVAQRTRNAAALTELLAGTRGVVTPVVAPGRRHVWHQYTIRVTDESARSRDDVVTHLAEAGVGAGVYYPSLITDYAVYRDHPSVIHAETPVARDVANQVISLPVHQHLAADDLPIIAAAVRRAVGEGA